MPTATVHFQQSEPHYPESPFDVAVRVGHQGYGSVELDMTESGLFDAAEMYPGTFLWMTLDEVMRHSLVTGVTFRGPWTS